MKHKFSRAYDIFETPDSKYLIALYTSKINIFSADDMKIICEFKDIKHPAYIAFSPDSNVFAIKNTSGYIAVFSLESLSCISKNKLTGVEGRNIVFDQDGKNVVCCDWDGNIHIYNYFDNDFKICEIAKRESFGMINCIRKIDDCFYFFFDKGIVKWKFPFNKNKISKQIFEPESWFYRIVTAKYSNSNNEIATAKITDNRVLIYNNYTEKLEKQILLNNRVLDLDWSSDGKYILITCMHYDTITIPMVSYNNTTNYAVPKNIGNVIIMRIEDGHVMESFIVEHVRLAKFTNDMKHIFIGTYSECLSYELSELNF